MSIPFLYNNVTPLDMNRHGSLKLSRTITSLGIAKDENLLPTVMKEFMFGCRDLPILFIKTSTDDISPIFLLGARPKSNSFISSDGQWNGHYLPAYLRRYPFIAGDVPGSDNIICIDDGFSGLNTHEGDPLFEESGQPSHVLSNASRLCAEYSEASTETSIFVRHIQDLDLFKSVSLDISFKSGTTSSLHGLLTIDDEKFSSLSTKHFNRLRKLNYLPAIYAHFISLANLEKLAVS